MLKKILIIIPLIICMLLTGCSSEETKTVTAQLHANTWLYGYSYQDAQRGHTVVKFYSDKVTVEYCEYGETTKTETYSIEIKNNEIEVTPGKDCAFFENTTYVANISESKVTLITEDSNILLFAKEDMSTHPVDNDELIGYWNADNAEYCFDDTHSGKVSEFTGYRWTTKEFTYSLKYSKDSDIERQLVITYEDETTENYIIKYSDNINTITLTDSSETKTLYRQEGEVNVIA